MTKKNVLRSCGILVLCLAICLSSVACGCQNSGAASAPVGTTGTGTMEYTVCVNAQTGTPLEEIGVYIYTDSTMSELVWFAKTDAEGKLSFSDIPSDNFVAVLADVPAGYLVEDYYPLTGELTQIKLSAGLMEGDLSTVTYKLGDLMLDFSVTGPDGTVYKFSELLEEKKAATQVVKTETPVAESAYVSEEPSKTEKMLTEFIGKFSYDVILQEIKRAVREEVLKELAENSVTENMNYEAVTKEATEKTVETVKGVAEEKQEKSIFADLFASEPIEDEEDDIFAALFGDDTEEEQKGKDEEFNIFAFFEEQDAMDKKISIIEKMEVFGDKVIEITLEDLALYNRNMYQRG